MKDLLEEIRNLRDTSKNAKSFSNKIKNRFDIKEFLDLSVPELPPLADYSKKAFWLLNGIHEKRKCPVCGNPVENDKCDVFGYKSKKPPHCSSKCQYADKTILEKAKKTKLDKYGNENFNNRLKAEKTCIEKYNVKNQFQSQVIKEKIKQTKLQRYGNENFINKEQAEKTNIERYGCKNVFANREIREKIKETWIKKYGVDHFMKNESFSKALTKKMLQSRLHQSYNSFILNDEYSMPNFTESFFIDNYDRNFEFEFVCKKCGKKFKSIYFDAWHSRCPDCYSNLCGKSFEEIEFINFIKSIYDGEIKENCKDIIGPKSIDCYLPDLKIGFEYDGLYFHSLEGGNKDSNYHINKTESCEKNNIQLIHIFSDEWILKRDIVKSRVKNLLGLYDHKCFARQCEVKEISYKLAKEFLEQNHIQGSVNSNINIGLYFNNELVSLMTFGKSRFNKHYEWELLRFCNSLGWHIPGAAGKLLAYFEKKYKPSSLLSYADRRWSIGNVYFKLGFSLVGKSKPSYWYLPKGCHAREYRYKYRKSELPKILPFFDPTKTEQENMRLNGFMRIYDCGNLIFEKNITE